MTFSSVRLALFVLMVVVMAVVQACSLTPYEPGSINSVRVVQRAELQEQGAFTVRASVPSEEEARQIFGIPLYNRGIQPVWLEITNNSANRARFIVSSVDRDYFSPLEVAYMHKKYFSKQGWLDMEEFLYANTMPRMIGAGATESGFVFTHASRGTKSFNVEIFHTQAIDKYEEFTFFVKVPGFVPDHAEVDFAKLYPSDEVSNVSHDELNETLSALPCCTTNREGDGLGLPANVVLVAKGKSLLRALLRAEWSESSYEKNDIYLNNSSYLYGRPPDAIFKSSRGNTTERNELSLWLSSYTFQGVPVWMGQISRDIGVRFTPKTITTHKIDPNVDETREYLLENLGYAQSLAKFGYVGGVGEVSIDQPKGNLTGDPWFTDGYRLVLWVSSEPIVLSELEFLDWRQPHN